MRKVLFASVASLAVAILVGCETKPSGEHSTKSTNTATRPAAAATPSESDLAAVQSYVEDKATKPGTGPARGGDAHGAERNPTGTSESKAAAPSGGSAHAPAGHPPIGGNAGELSFDAPGEWTKQQPRSSMRKAQFALPKVEGDSEDGEVVVFFFGKGEGGPVRDNITRWRGQFKTADGKPLPPESAKEEKFDAGGLPVTWLDVSGRYDPGQMPGIPNTGPRDHFRMFAAVIEAPSGAWFVKATGPAATMARQEENVRAYVKSARSAK